VTDYAAIAGYGIASTPGIVIDGKVVHGRLAQAEDLARGLGLDGAMLVQSARYESEPFEMS